MQLLTAFQSGFGMVNIGEYGAKTAANPVGRFAAEDFKSLVLTQALFT
jgi:hypothetical protein